MKSSSKHQPPQAENDISTNNNERGRRPIRRATKAALESIGKVLNYERTITLEKDNTIEDPTFIFLPELKVPDVRAPSVDGLNNFDGTDDSTILEQSTVTKDYGVSAQVHRSGTRHSSSIGGSTLKTLHT